MEHSDLTKSIENAVKKEAVKLFEKMKSESTTYGEVNQKLYELTWGKGGPYFGLIVKEARKMLHEEVKGLKISG
ncbi:hypothetical protein EDD68_10774 [Melghiribacillus thermohalophilus]|uniref:Uncharacterized protein n=1 Tax=Melghiribacillus thermohalophilus TaxID=1324956 RepID=A0A4R3N2M7_9BACI|nr:hypothetical protein [Melghiribacillus thermohalophilus]TCT23360.1 hypothetical protein EDD68_10774 [Melghiribacillus thermohalophilus]